MKICETIDCVGCGACVVSCSKAAIRFVEDKEGFFRPRVDDKLCVKCMRCRQVCPVVTSRIPERFAEAECYGGAASDRNEVESSTSGGVASAIARRIVANGGVAIGAAFNPFPQVEHIAIEKVADIERIKGSKYVESRILNAFKLVRNALKGGKPVLFIGLPCHVAALYGYLGKDDESLYTIDLICHGKPPQKLFTHWAETLHRKLGGEIVAYKFRDKGKCDWNSVRTHLHAYSLRDGRSGSVPAEWNWYGRYFLGSAVFRSCCYHCRFAKLPRVGDITLADFWNGEKDPRLVRFSKSGLSLVSVQSEKGRRLVKDACHLDLVAVSSEFALSCNRGLNHASRQTIYRRFVYKFVYLPESVRAICDKLLFGTAALVEKIFWRRR